MKRGMAFEERVRWFGALLPANAVIGGLQTLVPIYIVATGGTVIDVSIAVSASNLALIPSALLWGRMADKLASRRPIILFSYLGVALTVASMYLTQGLGQLVPTYALFSFFSSGTTPVISLLLMETTPKARWSRMFGRLSSISTLGLMLGSLPGVFWTSFFGLKTYFLLCLVFAFFALATAYAWVPEPTITLERKAEMHSPESLRHRLLVLPLVFFKMPSATDFRRFWRMIKGVGKEIPLIYVSMLLFYASGSLFYTSYTPFLVAGGVGDRDVFLAYSFLFLANMVTFVLAGRTVSRYGEGVSAAAATLVRTVAMASAGLMALGLKGGPLLVSSIILFSVIATTYSFAYTATSVLLFRTIGAEHQGDLLGIYSALSAVGLLVGAYSSGILSFHYGFTATFLSAAGLLGVTFIILCSFIQKKTSR